MSSASSITDEVGSSRSSSPVARGKGRGRRRGRGRSSSRGGRGRSRSSVSSGRGRGRSAGNVQQSEDILNRQKEELKTEIQGMSIDTLRETLCRVVEIQPSIMLDIMKPSQRQPGGHHPSPDAQTPDWCTCGLCREMPTQVEKKCCNKQRCVSQHANFEILILDEGVLALARLYRRDVFVFEDEADIVKANRHQAYRQFILWTHGRLTTGDRRVIPSCCVWKIRDKFPDPFGQYTGFIPSRIG